LNARNTKNTIALIALILVLLLLASCTGGVVSRGWAGVTKINDTLIFAAMSGKVYSVDTSGNVLGEPISLVVAASGGLSCIPSCGGQQTRAIAMYASPGVSGDLVYFAGNDGRVHAYQLVEGRLRDQTRWIYPPDGDLGSTIIGGLTIANDKIFLSSATGAVYALTAAEGYKEWSINLDQKIWSTPAVGTDTIYIGSFDKKLYALDIASGTIKWEYTTEGAISAPPLVDNDIIYIGSYDRHIYALDKTGALLWKYPSTENVTNSPENWFWVQPLIVNGVLYAPCLDGKVYVIDASNGGFIDSIDLRYNDNKGSISSSPVIVDNMMVIAVSDLAKKTSRVYAIDTTNRNVRELTGFTTEAINAPLFTSEGIVYIHTTSDVFYGLNAQNGALQKFSLTTSK
jgi:outer membrane protein assembly factor BamB